MLPLSRNESSVKTPGKTLAKTPGKVTSSINRATGTIKKQPVNRYHSFNTPSKRVTAADPSRYSELPATSDMSYMTKESMDNQTFMNISTSTEFEGPSAQHPSITNLTSTPAMPSFSPLMRQIEATIDKKITSFMNSFINQTATSADVTMQLRCDAREAVMNGMKEIRDAVDDTSVNSTFEVPACSTVVKRDFPTVEDETKSMPPPAALTAMRTNRRLMTQDFHSPIKVFEATNQTVIPAPPRRSSRISIMQNIRMTKGPVVTQTEKKSRKTMIRNKIVDSYFNKSSSSIKNVTKKDHKAAIMDMMNTGSVKELQLLPTIGPKTAYQIVTHRLVKGKYKNLDEVKKALMMKQKSWEKFLEVNLIC
jgi:DNA uptake protein ComE-like DNA-binding protein